MQIFDKANLPPAVVKVIFGKASTSSAGYATIDEFAKVALVLNEGFAKK